MTNLDVESTDCLEQSARHRVTTGGCYCESVRYQVTGKMRSIIACHCSQCQKTSGSYVMATAALSQHLEIIDKDHQLKWFASSSSAKRGFCEHCGSQLFWRPNHGDKTSIMAGSLDDPNGLNIVAHIYHENKAPYVRLHPEELTIDGDGCDHSACQFEL